jgi:hypothetical protein
MMTKQERLSIEAEARSAVSELFGGVIVSNSRLLLGAEGAIHEFDLYAKDQVIGGVSNSPLQTSGGNRNTGGCDRACSELLWLSLWSGEESRIHVLTDKLLAEWLVGRYRGVAFPNEIVVYHFDRSSKKLTRVGALGT